MSPNEYKELVDFLGRKFDRIDQRFEQIDQRFEQIDQRFEQIDQRFDRLEQRMDSFEARLTRVEILGEKNQSDLQAVAEAVRVLDRRLEAFQGWVEREFAAVRGEMKAGFDAVHLRVDRLEELAA
jgi:chromosome segregation ATPase